MTIWPSLKLPPLYEFVKSQIVAQIFNTLWKRCKIKSPNLVLLTIFFAHFVFLHTFAFCAFPFLLGCCSLLNLALSSALCAAQSSFKLFKRETGSSYKWNHLFSHSNYFTRDILVISVTQKLKHFSSSSSSPSSSSPSSSSSSSATALQP